MAAPRFITIAEFNQSRYAQVGEELNIADLLARAEAAVEAKLHYKIPRTTYTESWWPTSQTIYFRNRPLLDITAINRRTRFGDLWYPLDVAQLEVHENAGYAVAHRNTIIGYNIQAIYDAGLDPVPDDLKEAVLLQAVLLSFQDTEVYGAGDGKKPGILYMYEDLLNMLI